MAHLRSLVTSVMVAWAAIGIAASDNARDAFVRTWQGKSVTVKRTFYTLVFHERGKLGSIHRNRRAGLNVVTPFNGAYLQFDGRQSHDDIVGQDPQRIADEVRAEYQRDALDVRDYQKIEPVVVSQYDVGTELVVAAVRIDHDLVKLSFRDPETDLGGEPAAELTVKWATPFSKAMTERQAVEGLIAQFVAMKPVLTERR